MVEQLSGLAGILAGQQVDLAEDADGAVGDVFQVPDRCGDQV
jgi:hypothetical protein